MTGILLTKDSGFLGPVASLLGYIMDGIYYVLNHLFDIQNIGLCIILFTIIVYLCMLPLTIKQQKFSKLSAKMNPEIQAINKKYRGKKDQNSMMKMNEETKAVYEKYGTSPTGSCLQLLIQMPILLALYRVIYNIPAYVGQVKEVFEPLANQILSNNAAKDFMSSWCESSGRVSFAENQNTMIDIMYKFSSADWDQFSSSVSGMSGMINDTASSVAHMNNFFGINISNSPSEMFAAGAIIVALIIPILSGITQLINVKLMPQPEQMPGAEANPMASSMKTMNMIMPLFSVFFCFTLPAGMGVYWIAGSVVRSIQQVIINRFMEKVDMEQIIKKNQEKANKKREKKGLPPRQLTNAAKMDVKNISSDQEKKEKTIVSEKRQASPDGIAARAKMVNSFNRNDKK